MVPVCNPLFQNVLLFAAIAAALCVFGGSKEEGVLDRSHTTALKGFAILAVIFAHIGYFLVADHRFLFPLSTFAGVGVDIFLLLSGFGLTMSAISKHRPVLDFYFRHAKKIYLPMWIMVAILFPLDFFLLGRRYSTMYVAHTFLGFFPSANLSADIDSPLWFFTLILWFYFLFPLLFSRHRPALSALVLAALTLLVVHIATPFLSGVIYLYALHTLAFPFGMLVASLYSTHGKRIDSLIVAFDMRWRLPLIGSLFALLWFFTVHSGVGTPFAQYVSLVLVCLVLFFFALQHSQSRLLVLLGAYSYEIYLLHWPLMSRYDILYATLPASVATVLYIPIFLALAYLLRLADAKLLGALARRTRSQ